MSPHPSSSGPLPRTDLSEQLAELAAPPDARGPVPAQVCRTCVDLLPVSGAAISVYRHHALVATVCASDGTAEQLEDLQLALRGGPGVAAAQSGLPVAVPDLTDGRSTEWPVFARAARAMGVRAVFAFPLTVGATPLGALALYARAIGDLTATERSLARVLAESATVGLLEQQAIRLPCPLHRNEVHQATGVLMAQLGVGPADALIRLRTHALAGERSLADVAGDVVAHRIRLDRPTS